MIRDWVHKVIVTVDAWPGIATAPHRFGGQQFNWGRVEIGHIHRSGMVDVPFTRGVRAALVAQDCAEPHHLLPETGWVSFYLRGPDDVARALWLVQLSYLLKQRSRTHPQSPQRTQLDQQLSGLAVCGNLAAVIGVEDEDGG